MSDQHAPEGLADAARDAGLRNDLDLEPVLHTPRSLDSLVPGPVTAQGPAQIGMTLRKIFVAFMVLLSLALSACGGDNKNPIAPTPVPAPTPAPAPTPLAPADEAAFNTFSVGKRVTNDPTSYVDFVSPGRFRETEGSDIWTGSYTYRNTGSDTGTVTFNYDDGDRCTTSLTFDSTTSGTSTYTCNDGTSGSSNWRLAPTPTPTTAPDLVVDAPTVNDNSPATGATFTLSATVRNAGDGESAATTLQYYRSADATISSSDTEVGTDAVEALAASRSYLGSVDLTAPSTAGTYYYGACVDAVTDESDTTNNCSASVTVTVPEPPTSPVETQGCPADAETWRGLKVCDERPRDGYARDAFGTGYSSLEDEIIAALPPTMKANGQVYTPYSCLAFDITANGTAATDIEHIVALAETHDSGIADERRRDIASDLDNLTIADPTVNRSQKSDRDAAEWMPARHGAWFAERVIQVKLEYGLSVDPAERDALEALLAGGEAQLNCVGTPPAA